jgi:hypothetical protein
VFDLFVAWMSQAPKAAAGGATDLWNAGQENFEEMYKNTWRGAMVEAALHSNRKAFDEIMCQFAQAHPSWFEGEHADLLKAAVEFDLLTRPYAYVNTPLEVGVELEHLTLVETDGQTFIVDAPFDLAAINKCLRTSNELPVELLAPNPSRITIDHARGQIFRMPFKRDEDHHQFCHQFVTEIGNSLPVCALKKSDPVLST